MDESAAVAVVRHLTQVPTSEVFDPASNFCAAIVRAALNRHRGLQTERVVPLPESYVKTGPMLMTHEARLANLRFRSSMPACCNGAECLVYQLRTLSGALYTGVPLSAVEAWPAMLHAACHPDFVNRFALGTPCLLCLDLEILTKLDLASPTPPSVGISSAAIYDERSTINIGGIDVLPFNSDRLHIASYTVNNTTVVYVDERAHFKWSVYRSAQTWDTRSAYSGHPLPLAAIAHQMAMRNPTVINSPDKDPIFYITPTIQDALVKVCQDALYKPHITSADPFLDYICNKTALPSDIQSAMARYGALFFENNERALSLDPSEDDHIFVANCFRIALDALPGIRHLLTLRGFDFTDHMQVTHTPMFFDQPSLSQEQASSVVMRAYNLMLSARQTLPQIDSHHIYLNAAKQKQAIMRRSIRSAFAFCANCTKIFNLNSKHRKQIVIHDDLLCCGLCNQSTVVLIAPGRDSAEQLSRQCFYKAHRMSVSDMKTSVHIGYNTLCERHSYLLDLLRSIIVPLDQRALPRKKLRGELDEHALRRLSKCKKKAKGSTRRI